MPERVTLTRRDMLEVEQLTGEPFGRLFLENGDGPPVPTAKGMFGLEYLAAKKAGLIDPDETSWDDWLDGDAETYDLEVDSGPLDETNS